MTSITADRRTLTLGSEKSAVDKIRQGIRI